MQLGQLIPHILDVWRRAGKVSQLRANGESMSPLIGPNSILWVVHCPPQELKLGDIVVIQAGRGLVAHRLVYQQLIKEGVFWGEKGDNSPRINIIPQENILCQVQQIEDERGVQWVNKGWGRFINRLLGTYWQLIISLFLAKQRISTQQPEGQNPLTPCWLESSKLNLHYIPRFLIKLSCRSEKQT